MHHSLEPKYNYLLSQMHVFDRGLGNQEKEEKEVCLIRDFTDYRYNNLHYVNRFFFAPFKGNAQAYDTTGTLY